MWFQIELRIYRQMKLWIRIKDLFFILLNRLNCPIQMYLKSAPRISVGDGEESSSSKSAVSKRCGWIIFILLDWLNLLWWWNWKGDFEGSASFVDDGIDVFISDPLLSTNGITVIVLDLQAWGSACSWNEWSSGGHPHSNDVLLFGFYNVRRVDLIDNPRSWGGSISVDISTEDLRSSPAQINWS